VQDREGGGALVTEWELVFASYSALEKDIRTSL
jgi:hypothetical protein